MPLIARIVHTAWVLLAPVIMSNSATAPAVQVTAIVPVELSGAVSWRLQAHSR